MPDKPTPDEIALWQRRLASQANNRAWTLAELTEQLPNPQDRKILEATLRILPKPQDV
jgi:hypothetical protein